MLHYCQSFSGAPLVCAVVTLPSFCYWEMLCCHFIINIFFFKALEVKVTTLTVYHKERKRELEEARSSLKEECMDLDAQKCVGMDFARCFLILRKCVYFLCTVFLCVVVLCVSVVLHACNWKKIYVMFSQFQLQRNTRIC